MRWANKFYACKNVPRPGWKKVNGGFAKRHSCWITEPQSVSRSRVSRWNLIHRTWKLWTESSTAIFNLSHPRAQGDRIPETASLCHEEDRKTERHEKKTHPQLSSRPTAQSRSSCDMKLCPSSRLFAKILRAMPAGHGPTHVLYKNLYAQLPLTHFANLVHRRPSSS